MLFFENFDRDFGPLGMEIAKIGLQIRHTRIRLYANFGTFSCIFSLKNNQLACFFSHPVVEFKLFLEKVFSYVIVGNGMGNLPFDPLLDVS